MVGRYEYRAPDGQGASPFNNHSGTEDPKREPDDYFDKRIEQSAVLVL